MFNRLRTRLTLAIILLVAIPMLLSGTLTSLQAFSAQEREAVAVQALLAARVSDQINEYIHDRENEMNTLIEVGNLPQLSRQVQKDELAALLHFQGAYDEMTLVDAQGLEIARASRLGVINEESSGSRADDVAFTASRDTGETYFSPVGFSPVTGEPFMTLAIPMTNLRSGEFQGSLIARVRFKPVWNLLSDFTEPGVNQLYIVDQTDHVIAHANPSVVLSNKIFAVPESSQNTVGLDGQEVILASQNIQFGDQTFKLVVESPRVVALAEPFRLATVNGAVFGITLIVAVLAGVFLANQVTRPVEELTRVVGHFSAGKLDERTHVTSGDEIGTLARTFNTMADDLQQMVGSLEASVKEARTATAMAREANRLKSEFLSIMSHELRTPLNAIIGFAEILLGGMMGEMNDKQTHKLSRILLNSKRLLELINDLLDLAKIEAGRVEVLHEPFAPATLGASIQAQTESLAMQKSLDFRVEVDRSLPEMMLGDSSRIEQVAKNLISNAVKFTNTGSVMVRMFDNGDNTWSMSVTDTGIGIPPHALEFIFDEFRQVDGTSQRAYGGSGLGLAITRNLARIMGGDVRVSSTLGEGSTFTITLPLAVPERTAEMVRAFA